MPTLGNLVPLVILFLVVGGGGYIGYQMYLWSNEMTDRGKKHMEKKHMTFTKEGGLKVGVKELKGEAYEDKTQNVLVNVWNSAQPNGKKNPGSGSRPSTARTNSGQPRPNSSRTASSSGAATNLSPPASLGGDRRSASPVPGGWS